MRYGVLSTIGLFCLGLQKYKGVSENLKNNTDGHGIFFQNFFWVLPGTITKIFTKGKLLPRTFSDMSKNWYHIVD